MTTVEKLGAVTRVPNLPPGANSRNGWPVDRWQLSPFKSWQMKQNESNMFPPGVERLKELSLAQPVERWADLHLGLGLQLSNPIAIGVLYLRFGTRLFLYLPCATIGWTIVAESSISSPRTWCFDFILGIDLSSLFRHGKPYRVSGLPPHFTWSVAGPWQLWLNKVRRITLIDHHLPMGPQKCQLETKQG